MSYFLRSVALLLMIGCLFRIMETMVFSDGQIAAWILVMAGAAGLFAWAGKFDKASQS